MAEAKTTKTAAKKPAEPQVQVEFKKVAAELAAIHPMDTSTETLQKKKQLNAKMMQIITQAKREGVFINKK